MAKSNRLAARLSDHALKDLSGPAVFARGQAYAASGAIETLEVAALKAGDLAAQQAHIHGTRTYRVRLAVTAQGRIDGACDCPHAEGGHFCKHQVALALAWRTGLEGAAAAPDALAARKVVEAAQHARAQAEKRNTLRRFVHGQSAPVLAERLWAWAERDRAGMAELKAWAAASSVGKDPVALRNTLTALLHAPCDTLDPYATTAYAQRGRAIVGLLAPWVGRDAAMGQDLCEHALRCMGKVAEHADDADGHLGRLVQEVVALHAAMLRAG